MPAASNGVLAGNWGWGYECPQHGYLLVDMGPDRRHPVKAGASRAPASRLTALTGCRRPGKARHAGKGGSVSPHASISTPQVDDSSFDFRRGFPRCFHPMDPDEGASAWRRKTNRMGLVRPTTTDRTAASPSIPAFGGLQKPSADSLRARRVSLRPPPMTMNHGGDSNVGSRCPKLGWGFLKSTACSSCVAHSHR